MLLFVFLAPLQYCVGAWTVRETGLCSLEMVVDGFYLFSREHELWFVADAVWFWVGF